MILFLRIPRRARALIGAVTGLLLVTQAHHLFVGPSTPGVADSHIRESVALASTLATQAAEAGTALANRAAPVEEQADKAEWLLDKLAVKPPYVEPPAVDPAPAPEPAPPAPEAPMVALTFDDGPWRGQTEQVLAILAERDVRATFFILGCQVERAPDLAQAIANAGHLIGNHTYSHRRLDTAPYDLVDWEVSWGAHRIETVTGIHPTWFRAPGGNFGQAAYEAAERAGSRPALWTVDPQDWRDNATPDEIAGNVLTTAHPGAIVVLHDGGGDQTSTIAALPAIIDGLRAQGYRFVTLDELPSVRGGW